MGCSSGLVLLVFVKAQEEERPRDDGFGHNGEERGSAEPSATGQRPCEGLSRTHRAPLTYGVCDIILKPDGRARRGRPCARIRRQPRDHEDS
jgi:hypothetical protein